MLLVFISVEYYVNYIQGVSNNYYIFLNKKYINL